MAVEIERKSLVAGVGWRSATRDRRDIADYLIARFEKESGKARLRICDGEAMLTIKGPRRGIKRNEIHVSLTDGDARSMIDEFVLAPPLRKIRHEVEFDGFLWQVDEYLGYLEGLVTCEIELPSEDSLFAKPPWLGREVTADTRFRATALTTLAEDGDRIAIRDLIKQTQSVQV